jgi:ketosteroid isomerase-like protein
MISAEDVVAVAELVARYNRSFDDSDVDTWVGTFISDGTFVTKSDGPVSGHDRLRSWFATAIHDTIHVTANPTLAEDGDIVRHHCTVLVLRRREEGIVISSAGAYDDVVTRTEEGWRFVTRVPVTTPVIGLGATH